MQIDEKLISLGWNSVFAREYEQYAGSGLEPARITARDRNFYTAAGSFGSGQAQLSGRFEFTVSEPSEFPAVGDWVLLHDGGGVYIIERVLDRKSLLSRMAAGPRSVEQVMAANIDIMFVTAAMAGGRNFTERGLERYLLMVREGGAEPVIVLNKCDLCVEEERMDYVTRARSVAGGARILAVSALTGEGAEALQQLVSTGTTAAFTGPSGVGKSALVNMLLEKETQRTGAVREEDKRGRHTTVRQELFVLDSGGIVIDTAGLRELQPAASPETVDGLFEEISEAAAGCRFKDCTHTGEPGCNVLKLVEEGHVDYDRYQSYVSIRSEMEHRQLRMSERGRAELKARGKALARLVREHKKRKEGE